MRSNRLAFSLVSVMVALRVSRERINGTVIAGNHFRDFICRYKMRCLSETVFPDLIRTLYLKGREAVRLGQCGTGPPLNIWFWIDAKPCRLC